MVLCFFIRVPRHIELDLEAPKRYHAQCDPVRDNYLRKFNILDNFFEIFPQITYVNYNTVWKMLAYSVENSNSMMKLLCLFLFAVSHQVTFLIESIFPFELMLNFLQVFTFLVFEKIAYRFNGDFYTGNFSIGKLPNGITTLNMNTKLTKPLSGKIMVTIMKR
jgi:hypothetical protein